MFCMFYVTNMQMENEYLHFTLQQFSDLLLLLLLLLRLLSISKHTQHRLYVMYDNHIITIYFTHFTPTPTPYYQKISKVKKEKSPLPSKKMLRFRAYLYVDFIHKSTYIMYMFAHISSSEFAGKIPPFFYCSPDGSRKLRIL